MRLRFQLFCIIATIFHIRNKNEILSLLILMVYVPVLINLKQLLKNTKPDVIGLQEIKVADEDFPHAITENLGYHVFSPWVKKGTMGVALLTKQEPKAVRRGFPTDNEDAQKRIIMADLETPFGLLTVINGYFPQGEKPCS